MLTSIENRMEELLEQIDMLPPEKVQAAEKVSGLAVLAVCVTRDGLFV
jgi:hypothetical protein